MKTNIATTQDQSQRLLRCVVSADTADMCWYIESGEINIEKLRLDTELIGCSYDDPKRHYEYIPAWSLNSLLGLLPQEIKVDESPYDEVQKYGLLIYPFMGGWQVDYQYCEDDECHRLKCVHGADPIEACVKTIEWLTEDNHKLNEL